MYPRNTREVEGRAQRRRRRLLPHQRLRFIFLVILLPSLTLLARVVGACNWVVNGAPAGAAMQWWPLQFGGRREEQNPTRSAGQRSRIPKERTSCQPIMYRPRQFPPASPGLWDNLLAPAPEQSFHRGKAKARQSEAEQNRTEQTDQSRPRQTKATQSRSKPS